MANRPTACSDAQDPSDDSTFLIREQVDSALNRLLCDLALCADPDDAAFASATASVAELAGLVDSLASPVLGARMGGVTLAANLDELGRALSAFSNEWSAWKVHGDSALAPAAAVETVDAPAAAVVMPADSEPAASAAQEPPLDEDLIVLQADPELAGMFFGEAVDHLSTIESTVLQLEASPGDTKLLNDIFRPFHTIKGNAGALGITKIQEFAHKVENLLDLCRSGRLRFGPAEADATLAAVDVLGALVRDLQTRLNGQAGAADLEPRRRVLMEHVETLARGTGGAVPTDGGPDTARVPDHRVEVHVDAHPGVVQAAGDPPAVASVAKRPEETVAQASVKVDTRKLDNLVDMVGELVIAQAILQEDPALVGTADERLTRNLAQLKRITSDLQRNAMSMRMVPIRQTFQKMARLVRDLSKKSGKAVDLVLSGEETELDRRVVEDVNDPLMHMVRNSMDHGLEDAQRRVQMGKPATGRLALSAYHQGGNIVIAIEDDGAGLNTERILAKAVSQGLVAPGDTLTPAEIHQLIFRPGFSTAEKVTEISGRGVGMDVVRRNIDSLRGRVDIQSTPGQGTTFLIKLPLTLAILDGLLLGVGTERYVMPTFSVKESLRPTPAQVHSVQGHPCMIQVRGHLIPLLRLSDLFGLETCESDMCRSTVVVIEDDGDRVGLVVDRLLGKQEVVIKSLGEAFGQIVGVAGGAILGDGRVGLILDAHGIVHRTRSEGARAA
jgi:two-component system, chemotaxis family, sensor kinase CheA